MKNKLLENRLTIRGHSEPIYGIIYSEGFLYTCSADKHVVRWDYETGEQTNFVVKMERSAYQLAYAPKTNLLIIGENNGDLHVVDTQLKKEIRLLSQHKASVFSLIHSPETYRFYSGDRNGILCVWDDESFDLLHIDALNSGKIRQIAVSKDGQHFAVCGEDGTLKILDTEYFSVVNTLKVSDHSLNSILLDGDEVYIGGKTAFISKWNWKTGEQLENFKAHNYAVYDMIFLDNKTKLLSASFDKSIKLWDTETWELLETQNFLWDGHRSSVNRIAKVDEYNFATVSDDRLIKVWKLYDNENYNRD